MIYRANNKKKISTFALLGLFMIFSMLMTSTVEAQNLGDGQITETIAVASPNFTDTVGDGVTPTDESTPSSTPTDSSGLELTPTEGSTTETPTLPAEVPTIIEGQSTEGTQPAEETQTPDPEQTAESTETPSGNEGSSNPSATPPVNPTETVESTETPSGDEGSGDPSATPRLILLRQKMLLIRQRHLRLIPNRPKRSSLKRELQPPKIPQTVQVVQFGRPIQAALPRTSTIMILVSKSGSVLRIFTIIKPITGLLQKPDRVSRLS